MGKIWVEVCIISGRGLPRSSLWKFQWYAVGWIDPKNKYCTKIDASGNANPVWKTKFTTVIDVSESELQNIALNVEVYSREPLFMREKLQGNATVNLKELLVKHYKNSESGVEDVGSFQLRKKNSNKPQGFVDVSMRISEEKDGISSFFYVGNEDGFNLKGSSTSNTIATDRGSVHTHPAGHAKPPFYQLGNNRPPLPIQDRPYNHSYPPNYSNYAISRPSYEPASGLNHQKKPSYPPIINSNYPPRPPPPPSHVGYVPTFLPGTNSQSSSYLNMSSSGGGQANRPGFGMGLGAGALAAGAVIFGDDYMSGFELPASKM
ncbi:unnamed protein product [Amaranthus hypochondriacus]